MIALPLIYENLLRSSLTIAFGFSLFVTALQAQTSEPFFIPDSLKNYSFEELYEKQFTFEIFPKVEIFIEAYLHKAKNEKDSIRIANGYSQKITLNNFNDLSLNYIDSLLLLTKDWNHYTYPGYSNMIKAIYYYNFGDEKKALSSFLVARKSAIKNSNLEQLHYINLGITDLKIQWGDYKEAKSILFSERKSMFENKKLFKSNKGFQYDYEISRVLRQLSMVYLLNKQFDSAYHFSNMAISNVLKLKDSISYYDLVFTSGEIAYYNKEYERALDSLRKAFPHRNYLSNKIFHHYYLGNIFSKQKKENLAFNHFKKADSIYNVKNEIFPEIKEIQHYFVNYYRENGDRKNHLKYIDRLIQVDSIIDSNRIYLNETIKKEYDIPELLAAKEEILKSINKEKNQLNLLNTGLIGVVLLVLSYAIFSYRKNRIYKLKIKQFLDHREKLLEGLPIQKVTKIDGKNTSEIPDDIVQDILKKLDRFEKRKYFLNNKLTLPILSKRWKTNSTYLSKIINEHKQKNFSNYLTNLRVDYSIEKIITDKEFRKFKIEAIAQEVGFNNAQSFAKQFHSKTGVYPSFFIKEIVKLHAPNLNETG